jgi:hypothetical protein
MIGLEILEKASMESERSESGESIGLNTDEVVIFLDKPVKLEGEQRNHSLEDMPAFLAALWGITIGILAEREHNSNGETSVSQ